MDLSKLNKPEWVFHSKNSGDWDVYPYSVKAMEEVEKFLESGQDNPVEGIRTVMNIICKPHNSNEELDSRSKLAHDDMPEFTKADIELFSQEFLENNPNLIEEAEELPPKEKDQEHSDFLITVLEGENKRQRERLSDMFSHLKTRLGGILGTDNAGLRKVTQDLLKQNEDLERVYGSKSTIVSSQRNFNLPPVPENPIHKTNTHLTEMNARLDNLIKFGEEAIQRMHGLEVSAAVFLDRFSTEATNNSKSAKMAIIVGALAVMMSLGQIIYTEFRRVPQDTAAMEAALSSVRGDIKQLTTVLSEDFTNYHAAQETAYTNIANAVDTTGDTNTAILQRIDHLLQQQRERDQITLEALGAIVASIPSSEE